MTRETDIKPSDVLIIWIDGIRDTAVARNIRTPHVLACIQAMNDCRAYMPCTGYCSRFDDHAVQVSLESDMPRVRPLYVAIATALGALSGCRSDNANESQQSWAPRWESFIERAAQELPQGSGFDVHPTIESDDIKPNQIKITGSYHQMNESGYVRWIDYVVTVRPSLTNGIVLSITGGNADFKDYAYECFDVALRAEHGYDSFHDKPARLPAPVAES